MIEYLIKHNKDNKQSVWLYSTMILNRFKSEILKSINYNKIQIRYDYLKENKLLEFTTDTELNCQRLIFLLVNALQIRNIITNDNHYSTSICLYDYILIPNSNMTFSYFVRFVQYGNEDMPPYPFMDDTWDRLEKEREVLSSI
jgi:hypothetical protein